MKNLKKPAVKSKKTTNSFLLNGLNGLNLSSLSSLSSLSILSAFLFSLSGTPILNSTPAFAKKASEKNTEQTIEKTTTVKEIKEVTEIKDVNPNLIIDDETTQKVKITEMKEVKGEFTQIGFDNDSIKANPSNIKVLEGFAKDLPLIDVLQQITPAGWTVKSVKSVNAKKLVSWTGGKTWFDTLKDISITYGLNTVVDWNTKTVRLLSLDLVNPKIEKIAKLEIITAEVAKNMNDEMKENHLKPVNAAPAKTWIMDENKTLKENVIIWGKTANFRVQWQGQDYPVDVTYSLIGEFDDENSGVIKQLSDLYGVDKVKQPLLFELKMGNRTLVVTDKNYTQRFFKENNTGINAGK